MDPEPHLERLVAWIDTGLHDQKKVLTGSVVEFAFGIEPRSYFVTSYPHRAEYGPTDDVRTIAQ